MSGEDPRLPLEYESRVAPPPRASPPPVAVSVAAIICGSALVLAPWLAVGLGETNLSSQTLRYLFESPLTWLTILPGFVLLSLGYFRARR